MRWEIPAPPPGTIMILLIYILTIALQAPDDAPCQTVADYCLQAQDDAPRQTVAADTALTDEVCARCVCLIIMVPLWM